MSQLTQSSLNPQSDHTPVRKNIESHMLSQPRILQLVKRMAGVGLQFCARQNRLPGKFRIFQRFDCRLRGITTFKRTTLGKVSLEPGSINLKSVKVAWCAELNYRPVMSRSASPFGFPAVAHVCCLSPHY